MQCRMRSVSIHTPTTQVATKYGQPESIGFYIAFQLTGGWCSYEAAHAQILLYDDVVHRRHDESYLHRVRRACEMCVDLFRGMLVEPA